MVSNIAHLVVFMRGGLQDRLFDAVVVWDGCTVGALIEDRFVSRQVLELLGLPGQAEAWMLDVCVSSSTDLFHIAHRQVGFSVNLAPFSQVSGLFGIGDNDLLRP